MEMDLLSEWEITSEMGKRRPLLRSLRGDSRDIPFLFLVPAILNSFRVSSTTLCEVQNELYLILLAILKYNKTY